jgi:DNA-binding transcriptional LysR family regulator
MKINNLDLNKLKCFQAVAEKGSLLEGARTLGLTPSAVYQSVKKLEEDLGRHLFFRSGKRYIVTEDGKALQELFGKFLGEISHYQDKTKTELAGEIRVGLPLNYSKTVFVPLIKRFMERFPDVYFHLTIAETRRLMEQLSAFELDFAITDDAIPHEYLNRIQKKEIFKEELVMVCSNEFRRAHEKELKDVTKMKQLVHLDYAKDIPLMQLWYKLHYRRIVKIARLHSMDNVETMVAAIRAGLGMGIIPKALVDEELYVIGTQTKTLFNQLLLVQESNYINDRLIKEFLKEL